MNKLFKVFFIFTATLGLLFLFTEVEDYKFSPLESVSQMVTPYKEEGIYISAKTYSSEESKTYLHRDLLSRGFQPIQISIQNNTPKAYSLSNQSVNLPLISTNAVAFKVTKSAYPRLVGFKVAGFFFWPFMIPGTIDSIKTFKSHLKLRKDFAAKSIKRREEIIPAYSTIHRIIFVNKQDYQKEFTLSLKDQESETLNEFNIQVKE